MVISDSDEGHEEHEANIANEAWPRAFFVRFVARIRRYSPNSVRTADAICSAQASISPWSFPSSMIRSSGSVPE